MRRRDTRSRRALHAVVLALVMGAAILPAVSSRAQEAEHAAVAAQEPQHAAEAGQEPEHAADEHAVEGEHGEEEHHGPTWTEYAYKWINFFLLAGLLWWLLVVPPAFVVENFEFPGLKVVLAQRGREIVENRQLAEEQAAAAKASVADSEARLERVEQEAAALLDEAREDADRERHRIVAAAETEADRIREHAQRDMGAEVTRARRELKRHVADLSVGMAADMVKNNLSSEDQERLVREYLDRLGQATAS